MRRSSASTTGHRGCISRSSGCRSERDRETDGHNSVAFTYGYGHLFPETDRHAATKLDAIRASGLDGRAVGS